MSAASWPISKNILASSPCLRTADRRHRGLRPIVDDELEYVGARIMTGRIEVVFAARYVVEIDVGVENGFAVEVRPRQHLAKRVDDGAAAAHQHGLGIVAERTFVVLGKCAALEVLAGGQHKAAALKRNVLHRRQPGVTIVSRG